MRRAAIVWALLILSATGCTMGRTGVVDGKLHPCPISPNCVCSQDPKPGRRVAPLSYTGSEQAAMARLAGVVEAMPRTKIVARHGGYLHAVFRSRVFRFADDVEFLADDEAKVIHIRSGSRLGWSDLGVNRRRVAALHTAFLKSLEATP